MALVVQVSEEPAQVGVVRRLVEAQVSAVRHVSRHFFRIPEAERVNGCLDFAFFDLLVFVFFIPGAEALPGELALKQVKKYVASALKVISSALFDTQMRGS